MDAVLRHDDCFCLFYLFFFFWHLIVNTDIPKDDIQTLFSQPFYTKNYISFIDLR